jgi:hypothetical protein
VAWACRSTGHSAWGYAGRDGVVMPGSGRVEAEAEWPRAAELRGRLSTVAPHANDPLSLLGAPLGVHLNNDTYWGFVPGAVWQYRVGGYQVIKKWAFAMV